MQRDSDSLTTAEAASALGWWLEAGVDVAVQDSPRDWLAAASPPPAAATPPALAPSVPAEPALPETLDLFRDWLAASPPPPRATAAARRALPHGAEGAAVMLIAEMPAREDVADGRPIGGTAWALMERMLAAIGIAPEDCYSASLSCFHAPAGRMDADELAACATIARRHVALARPKRLLLLGDAPAKALLGKPLVEARGHVHRVEGVRTVATFHPRFLLSRSSAKALAWQDLLSLTEESA